MSEWKFTVEQDGLIVAKGVAPNEEGATREAMHYSMMYSQDGAVKTKVQEVKKKTIARRK